MVIRRRELFRREFTIRQRVQNRNLLLIVHRLTSLEDSYIVINDRRTVARARATRDITVPIGISRTVAISLYFISSTSQSNRTSSNGAGSCSIAFWSVARFPI